MQDVLKGFQVKQSEAAAHMANLKAKIKDLEDKNKNNNEEKRSLERELSKWKKKHEEANKKITKLKEKAEGAVVSEHAIVRYFQRVLNFDLEEIKSKILGGNDPKAVIDLLSEGCLPLETHKCIIHEGVIVTVLTEEGQKH